ncbi:MAG: signal peptidase I [Candidatus Thermoplasmatota archaeon]
MKSEEEGPDEEDGNRPQSKTSKTSITLKKIKRVKVKDIYGSWDLSLWMFVGVIIVTLLLIMTVMLLLPFGVNPINRRAATVRSNSMEPTFERGDIVFLKDVEPEEIEEGDVIVLQVPDQYEEQYGYPPQVVHRVTDIRYDHRFDIDTSERDDIDFEDGEPAPGWLREEFDEENNYLSNDAEMVRSSDGAWWITVRGEREYRLEEDDGQVRIFDATPAFETKGDAEDQEDPFLTPPQNVMGEYSGSSISYWGLLFMFASTPIGMATLSIAFALVLVAIYFPWHIDKREERMDILRRLREGIEELRSGESLSATAKSMAASTEGTTTPSTSKASRIMMKMNENGKASVRVEEREEEEKEDIEDTPRTDIPRDILLVKKDDGKGIVKKSREREAEPEVESEKKIEKKV